MDSSRWIVSWIVSCFAALVLAGCSRQPDLPTLGQVSHFTLTDQTGSAFDSGAQLDHKVWVADFMFTTCPGPCPRMSSQMHQVQMALEKDGIRLVSFTVDPEHDTPAALAAYAKTYKASPGVWSFLTGTQADLNHLSKDVFKLGVVDGSLEHSTRFVLVDRAGQIRGYYLTSEADAIPHVIADARALLKAG
jgi:protein SCO1